MIIGLMGKAGSGKTSVSDILKLEHDYYHLAFATALKEKISRDFGISLLVLNDSIEKERIDTRYNLTPREILQRVGCFYRDIYENFWVEQVSNQIFEGLNNFNFCISDVRFPNEVQMIKDYGGYIIKIERDDRKEITNSNHISETVLDDFKDYDYVVQNFGTLNDLKHSVDVMINTLGGS